MKVKASRSRARHGAPSRKGQGIREELHFVSAASFGAGARFRTASLPPPPTRSATALSPAWEWKPENRTSSPPDRERPCLPNPARWRNPCCSRACRSVCLPRSSSPTIQRFFSFKSSRVRAMFVTFAMGRCSLAPADALVTVAVTPAARRSGITTPSAPEASAVRRMRSQIVRIFNAVQHDDQRISPALGSHHVIEIVVLFGRGDGHHALMGVVAGHAVEFRARQKTHGDAVAGGIRPPRAAGAGRAVPSARRPTRTSARAPSAPRRPH